MDDDLTVAFVRPPPPATTGEAKPTLLPAAPSAPGMWGSFELLARVGSGGFGEVYRAWDSSLQREVALKLLLPSLIDSDAEYEEILREARALAAVRHPNVLHVYGVNRHDGRVGFWTDFVHGSTLAALLKAQGPFGCREAALIGSDVAHALAAVHRSGMLHRDIKAENVMREEGGRILLMDFGLSSLPQQEHGIAGTPAYMAPELLAGIPATTCTDLYAVGVLLFFLVTGKYPVPFLGYSKEKVAGAQAQRLFLSDLRPDLPDSFLRTVSVVLDPDPKKRFASAGQLAAALSETLGVSPQPVEAPATPPAEEKSSTHPWRGAIITAIVLTFIFGKRVYNDFVRPSRPAQTQIAGVPAGNGASASAYDEYQKAQDLIVHSYLDRNLTAAVAILDKVLASDPQFALAEASLGRAYFLQYRNTHNTALLDKAQAATKRAIELDPNSSPAYVTLARMSTTAGQTSLAMQQVSKALSLDPLSAEALAAQADVFAAVNRPDEARKALSRAVDLAPDDWRFPVLLGNYEFDAGHLQEAAALYQRAVDLAPDNALAYFNLGDTQQRLGRLDQARVSFEKAIQIEPRSTYYSALGGLLSLQGKHAEAVQKSEHAAQLNPSDFYTLSNLAETYLSSPGGHDKALATYRRAVVQAESARAKSPRDATLLVMLAQSYAVLGEKMRSEPLVRQALALTPNDPTIAFHAGETYEILGQRPQALPLISRALASGYSADSVERDPQLAALRADPAFAAVLTHAKSSQQAR